MDNDMMNFDMMDDDMMDDERMSNEMFFNCVRNLTLPDELSIGNQSLG